MMRKRCCTKPEACVHRAFRFGPHNPPTRRSLAVWVFALNTSPPRLLKQLTLTSLLAAAFLTVPASASDKDHDRAREALKAGQVMPLRTVLERLEREHPGQVLDIEIEEEHGRLIYEVKLLQDDGRLIKLELDAKTATVLSRKDRGRRD
jgi:Peptidase propeptide and YPEB domain